jgi:YVTN family beta-propeller protein
MTGTERTLRRAGIVAAILALVAGFSAAVASAAPLGLVTDSNGGVVSVIATQTNSVVGEPIALGGRPASVAITPDGRFAYVVEETPRQVVVIELATRRVVGEPIEFGFQPGQIAISADGRTAYLANLSSKSIAVIDTRTDRMTGEVGLAADATGVAFAPDGRSAYVAEQEPAEVQIVDTQTESVVGQPIQLKGRPSSVAVAADGMTLYVGNVEAGLAVVDLATRKPTYASSQSTAGSVAISPDGKIAVVSQFGSDAISVVDLATRSLIKEIQVGENPGEAAITPDGLTAYVPAGLSPARGVRAIDLQSLTAVNPEISTSGDARAIAIAPDQSPTAVFAPPTAIVGAPAFFNGASSFDPDGTVTSWSWTFGDLDIASGITATHAYAFPGNYDAQLSVVDNEGCGFETVFTGRTAYCSGNPLAKVIHPVQVAPPPSGPACSTNFAVGGVSHNRKNGTVRLRLRFYSTGSFLLFGKKIHAVTRKVRRPGVAVVTLHARVELNKRLKKTLRAGVRYRVTFTPAAGCGSKTVHRSVALLRAPRKKHHR